MNRPKHLSNIPRDQCKLKASKAAVPWNDTPSTFEVSLVLWSKIVPDSVAPGC